MKHGLHIVAVVFWLSACGTPSRSPDVLAPADESAAPEIPSTADLAVPDDAVEPVDAVFSDSAELHGADGVTSDPGVAPDVQIVDGQSEMDSAAADLPIPSDVPVGDLAGGDSLLTDSAADVGSPDQLSVDTVHADVNDEVPAAPDSLDDSAAGDASGDSAGAADAESDVGEDLSGWDVFVLSDTTMPEVIPEEDADATSWPEVEDVPPILPDVPVGVDTVPLEDVVPGDDGSPDLPPEPLVDPYEPNDKADMAYPLGLIGPEGYDSLPGTSIDPGSDHDWFSFFIEDAAVLQVRGVPAAGQNLVILLRDEKGSLLWFADGGPDGAEENLFYALPANSHCLVEFKTWYGKGGSYSFRISPNPPADSEMDCFNKLDDDVDGVTDCSDADCATADLCVGETCLTAYPVNDGKPISEADSGLTLTYNDTTEGHANDYSGDCGAGYAPDVVWSFTLEQETQVEITLDFKGWINSSAVLTLRKDGCDGQLVQCKASKFYSPVIQEELGGGTYYVLIDRAGIGSGPYSITFKFVDVVTGDDCTNGIDEDGDGLLDCEDPDCVDSPFCQGAWCANALPVNQGQAIGTDDDGLALQLSGSTANLFDNYDCSCGSDSQTSGSEAVWKLTLSDPMLVSMCHQFEDFTLQPLLYVRGADCAPSAEIACGNNNPAMITSLLLDKGTYYVFVDSEEIGAIGNYTLYMHFTAL